MVRLLYGTAIAYFVVAMAVLLPPFLRHPSTESVPHLIPTFLIGCALWVIAVIHNGRLRPRAQRRWLWFWGIWGLVSGGSVIVIDALARRTDSRSALWVSGCILVAALAFLAARDAKPGPSEAQMNGAQPPPTVNP